MFRLLVTKPIDERTFMDMCRMIETTLPGISCVSPSATDEIGMLVEFLSPEAHCATIRFDNGDFNKHNFYYDVELKRYRGGRDEWNASTRQVFARGKVYTVYTPEKEWTMDEVQRIRDVLTSFPFTIA